MPQRQQRVLEPVHQRLLKPLQLAHALLGGELGREPRDVVCAVWPEVDSRHGHTLPAWPHRDGV